MRLRLLTKIVLSPTFPLSPAAPRPPIPRPLPPPSLSKASMHQNWMPTDKIQRLSTQYTCAGTSPGPVTKRQATAATVSAIETGDAAAQSCVESYASAYGTFGIRSACDCAFDAATTETVVRTIPGSVTVTESAVVSTRRPSSQAICASSVPRTKIFPGVGNSDRQRHLDELSEHNNASHRHHHRLHNSDRKSLIPSLIMSI